MRKLQMQRDDWNTPLLTVPPPDHVDALVLAAGQAKTHAVPAGARHVLLSATGTVHVAYDAAAQVPAGDVTDGSAAEMNPLLRSVEGVAQLGLAAPRACTVTLAFYA
jgi:hypothetical protein